MFTTFRLVTFPQLRSALLAGGLLAFALSFDEIIVTTFTIGAGDTTLPIWILQNLFRPNQAPVVNVVAVVLIVVSIVPIWLAQRLSQDSVGIGATRVKADGGLIRDAVDRHDGQEAAAQDLRGVGIGTDDGVIAGERRRLGRGSSGAAALPAVRRRRPASAGPAPAVPGLTAAWPCSRIPSWPSNTGCARFLESSMMEV